MWRVSSGLSWGKRTLPSTRPLWIVSPLLSQIVCSL